MRSHLIRLARWALALLIVLPPAAAPAQTPASRTLYRCTVGGVTTFSDRPCEPDAVPYEPDTSRVSTYSPPPASAAPQAAPQPRAPRNRGRAAAGDHQVRHAAACKRLRNGLKDVAARMRAGYSVKQGEQLRERKARLDAQRRAQKCS
jgi:hypothetical protein